MPLSLGVGLSVVTTRTVAQEIAESLKDDTSSPASRQEPAPESSTPETEQQADDDQQP